MKYNFNGKIINIPDKELEKSMKNLELTKEEAIEMYLEDEGYLDNEEQEELTKKAKESGIMSTIHGAKAINVEKKETKPKNVKVSNEKKELFSIIYNNLYEYSKENDIKVSILKENKLLQVEINNKIFKIDLIEQRQNKKGK